MVVRQPTLCPGCTKKGFISDPVSKAKSVTFTEDGTPRGRASVPRPLRRARLNPPLEPRAASDPSPASRHSQSAGAWFVGRLRMSAGPPLPAGRLGDLERATPRVGDGLHREASSSHELDREGSFFGRASSRASLRTSHPWSWRSPGVGRAGVWQHRALPPQERHGHAPPEGGTKPEPVRSISSQHTPSPHRRLHPDLARPS